MRRRYRIEYQIVDDDNDPYDGSNYGAFRTKKKAMKEFVAMSEKLGGFLLVRVQLNECTGTQVAGWFYRRGRVKKIGNGYFKWPSRMDIRAWKRNQRLTCKGQPYVPESDLEDVPF